jgi:hypothetical protein
MKNIFLTSILLLALQACSVLTTRNPQVQTRGASNTHQQLYAGDSVMSKEQVPSPVIAAWNKKHKAVNGEWHKATDGYMVYFIAKKYQSRILYDQNGGELLHGTEVKSENVPQPIREYMMAKYPGTQYGKTFFSSISNGDKEYCVYIGDSKWETFDSHGNSLEKKKQ